MSRERVKIRKAEEANALLDLTALEPNRRFDPRDFTFAVATRGAYLARIAGLFRRESGRFERPELEVEALARHLDTTDAVAIALGADSQLFGVSREEIHPFARTLRLPILWLDYCVDARQIQTARNSGADAVVVSAGMMGAPHLRRLVDEARAVGMAVVLESRDEADVVRAATVPHALHGLGDLSGEVADYPPDRIAALAAELPKGTVKLALTGVRGEQDLTDLRGVVDAAVIGRPWLSSPDPTEAADLWFKG